MVFFCSLFSRYDAVMRAKKVKSVTTICYAKMREVRPWLRRSSRAREMEKFMHGKFMTKPTNRTADHRM